MTTDQAIFEDLSTFKRFFEYDPDGIIVMNKNGDIFLVNHVLLEMFGYNQAELVGHSITMLLPERFRSQNELDIRQYAENPRKRPMSLNLNLVGQRKDGAEFDLDISISPVEVGGMSLVLANLRDITEYRRMEEALRQSEILFRTIFLGAGLGIKLIDLHGWIVVSNPAFQEMVGYNQVELNKMRFNELTHPDDMEAYEQLFTNLVEGKISFGRIEKRYYRKNGDIIWGRLAMSIIRDKEGQPLYAIAMVENITAQKQSEADLAELQSRLMDSREIERLQIAQDLHDGPLQELTGVSFMVNSLKDLPHTEEAMAILNDIQSTVTNIMGGIRTLTGELRPPSLVPYGLEKAIRSHVDQLHHKNPEIEVHLQLDNDGQTLPERVRLALFRIYQQSIINVIRHAKAQHAYIRLQLLKTETLLEIQDDGQGFVVPKSWLELARKGHYGLAGIAERVQAVGGKLVIQSNPGKGTLVRVIIPRTDESDQE